MLHLRINRDRFLETIADLSRIGLLSEEEGGGRDRRPFSEADRAARDYFRRKAESAGLAAALDGAANLSVRLNCADPQAQTLLIGSHLDTVPHGGAYDGALGVLAGLEVLRTLSENQVPLEHHVEVINFTDEEGRFGDFLGSRAVSGQIAEAQIRSFLEKATLYAGDLVAMREQVPGGLTVESIRQARRESSTLLGYLELHVEQGPRLEHEGASIGVVSAIFGRRSCQIIFRGRSDHAGTTPLHLRADALVAASRFIAAAPAVVGRDFPDAVVTCGNVTVQPGVYNVVPNAVTVWVEFRAASVVELDGIETQLLTLAAEACASAETTHVVNRTSRSEPTPMNGELQAAIREAAQTCGYPALDLPSGAGHDAQMMAAITPTAMLFVPSHNGRSHSPDEYTEPDDLVAGTNVLLHAVLTLAAA